METPNRWSYSVHLIHNSIDIFVTRGCLYININTKELLNEHKNLLFQVFAVTFVRFFVSPMKDIGVAFGEFLKALLIDLPITLYPLALAAVTVFFFLFLFMWMGYRISMPFFFSIEPGQPAAVTSDDSGSKEAIEEGTKQVQDKVHVKQVFFAFGLC